MVRLLRHVPVWARGVVLVAVAVGVRVMVYLLTRPRPVLHVVLAMPLKGG
jgi:hypothetical protein